jgi:membrane-bound serine protease (ClpP class)
MWLIALVLLVVVVGAAVVGLHAGPHGMLGAGALGVASCVALLALFASNDLTAAAWVLFGGVVVCSIGALAAGVAGVKALPALRSRRAHAGLGAVQGADGVAVTPLAPVGTVRVNGELWSAESLSGSLAAGSTVHVVGVEGLRLRVWSEAGVVIGAAGLGDDTEGQP